MTNCELHNCDMVLNNFECPASCTWLDSPCSNSRAVRQAQIEENSAKLRVVTCPTLRYQLHLEIKPGSFIEEGQYIGLYIGGICGRHGQRDAYRMNMDHVAGQLPELQSEYMMVMKDKHNLYTVDGGYRGNHTAYMQDGGKDSNCCFEHGVSCEGHYTIWGKTQTRVGHESIPVALTVDYGPEYGDHINLRTEGT